MGLSDTASKPKVEMVRDYGVGVRDFLAIEPKARKPHLFYLSNRRIDATELPDGPLAVREMPLLHAAGLFVLKKSPFSGSRRVRSRPKAFTVSSSPVACWLFGADQL